MQLFRSGYVFLERKTKGSEYVEKLYVPINAITGEEFYDMELKNNRLPAACVCSCIQAPHFAV